MISEVIQMVENKYNECYEIAKAKGIDLPKIDIEWNLKGTCAGQFCIRIGRKYFRVNLELAQQNIEEYLNQTVPHEFCHYITRHKYSYSVAPHGAEWKNAMVQFFGLDPRLCHSYDVSQVKQGRGRFEYKCSCKTFSIGPVRHKRLQMNPDKYYCPTCRGNLVLVKKV